MTGVLKRGRRDRFRRHREKAAMKTDADVGTLQQQARKCLGHWELLETRKDSPLEPPDGSTTLPTL